MDVVSLKASLVLFQVVLLYIGVVSWETKIFVPALISVVGLGFLINIV